MASGLGSFGAYTVVKLIGQGASGFAYVCTVKDDKGEVQCDKEGEPEKRVVKQMNQHNFTEREKQNAMNEISVMKRLNHPNIIKYFDSWDEGGLLYIVMEYAGGGDLQKRIEGQKNVYFDEEQILDWFTQICLAVKHCHDNKILHRDLKTENIFLSDNNRIKLGDFGLVKTLQSSMDMARTAAGTPYYLSPEICKGQTYNAKSDVWALGCVLYKLLTFKHAFQTTTLTILIEKIVKGDYKPIPRTFSADIRAMCDWLFTSNPDERPSVGDILSVPFIMKRIPNFLTPEQMVTEFGSASMAPLAPVAQESDSEELASFSASDEGKHVHKKRRRRHRKTEPTAENAAEAPTATLPDEEETPRHRSSRHRKPPVTPETEEMESPRRKHRGEERRPERDPRDEKINRTSSARTAKSLAGGTTKGVEDPPSRERRRRRVAHDPRDAGSESDSRN